MPRDLLAQAPAQPRDLLAAKPPQGPPAPAPAQPPVQAPSALSNFVAGQKRGAGLAARTTVNAVAGLPLMAADFGVALRNVGENAFAGRPLLQQTRELPSQMFDRGLDQAGLPRAQGIAEKTLDIVGQMVGGSRLPVPKVNNPAPANFASPAQQALGNASRSGYVIPPATAAPGSALASAAEGAAGKLSTGQLASAANQGVTNRLAAQAVGIADDGTISREALSAIRSEAGKAHEALRSFAGEIVSDTQYRMALSSAVRSFENTAKQIPQLAQSDILAIAKGLEQPRFDPGVAVDAISLLRDRASTAYRTGDASLGKAYRALSDAFEGLVERRVAASGQQGAGLVENFRAARELIAKTYSIEGALKGENVDAAALARALDRGKYLSGTLRQIGQFAQRFPKASRLTPAVESQPMYSPLDYMAGGASLTGAAMSGNPAALIPGFYAAGRPVLRNFLLSPAGQDLAINGISPNALGRGVNAAVPAMNALRRRE